MNRRLSVIIGHTLERGVALLETDEGWKVDEYLIDTEGRQMIHTPPTDYDAALAQYREIAARIATYS